MKKQLLLSLFLCLMGQSIIAQDPSYLQRFQRGYVQPGWQRARTLPGRTYKWIKEHPKTSAAIAAALFAAGGLLYGGIRRPIKGVSLGKSRAINQKVSELRATIQGIGEEQMKALAWMALYGVDDLVNYLNNKIGPVNTAVFLASFIFVEPNVQLTKQSTGIDDIKIQLTTVIETLKEEGGIADVDIIGDLRKKGGYDPQTGKKYRL